MTMGGSNLFTKITGSITSNISNISRHKKKVDRDKEAIRLLEHQEPYPVKEFEHVEYNDDAESHIEKMRQRIKKRDYNIN